MIIAIFFFQIYNTCVVLLKFLSAQCWYINVYIIIHRDD